MGERQRIYSYLGKVNDEMRVDLFKILAMHGYCVKIGKEKKGNSGKYVYFTEYWREEDDE